MRYGTNTFFVDDIDDVSLAINPGKSTPFIGAVQLTIADGTGLRGSLVHIYVSPRQLDALVLDGMAVQRALDDLAQPGASTDPDSPNAP
jgi:hypothetical protein